MGKIYNYEKNIKVVTTAGGEKVIMMNDAIFTTIRNAISDAAAYHKEKGYSCIAEDTERLWNALCDKNNASEK